MAALADALVTLTLDLLRVPSPIGHEGPLADLVEGRVAALGAAVRRERIGHNVVARADRAGAATTVGLFGHLDTVPGHAADPVRLEGGRLYGCGASDMKGGLAVMLALLAAAAAAGPAGPGAGAPPAHVVCVFYEREEGPYAESGLGPVLAESRLARGIDFAFCLEPTAGEVQVGCLGAMHARVRFAGRAAHSARPWQGDNAIYRAAPFLARIAARPPHDVVVQGLTYREVMSVTTARSHAVRNVVPDWFELNVNYRFAPGRSMEAARAEVLALVAGEAEVELPGAPLVEPGRLGAERVELPGAPLVEPGRLGVERVELPGAPLVEPGRLGAERVELPGAWVVEGRRATRGFIEVEFVDEAPAGPVTLDHPVLRRFLELTGAPVAPKQAWTDVARLGAAGVPAVNYGPGEPAQAHQTGEWAPVAPLAAARAALARLVGV